MHGRPTGFWSAPTAHTQRKGAQTGSSAVTNQTAETNIEAETEKKTKYILQTYNLPYVYDVYRYF